MTGKYKLKSSIFGKSALTENFMCEEEIEARISLAKDALNTKKRIFCSNMNQEARNNLENTKHIYHVSKYRYILNACKYELLIYCTSATDV